MNNPSISFGRLDVDEVVSTQTLAGELLKQGQAPWSDRNPIANRRPRSIRQDLAQRTRSVALYFATLSRTMPTTQNLGSSACPLLSPRLAQ